LLLLVAVALFGLAAMIRVLWIIAVIALILWLVGSLFRGEDERRYAL